MASAFFTIILLVTAFLFFAPNLFEAGVSSNATAILLAAVVSAYAVARALRWSFAKLLFRAGFPIAALVIFAVKQGGGDSAAVWSVIGGVMLIVIVLFGIFRIVYGAIPKKTKREWERES